MPKATGAERLFAFFHIVDDIQHQTFLRYEFAAFQSFHWRTLQLHSGFRKVGFAAGIDLVVEKIFFQQLPKIALAMKPLGNLTMRVFS